MRLLGCLAAVVVAMVILVMVGVPIMRTLVGVPDYNLRSGYYDQSVPMVDPPENAKPGDVAVLSQANANNAEANKLNEEARRIHETTDEAEELLEAQACATRGDCAVDTYQRGQKSGATNFLVWIFIGIVGFCVAFVLFAKR